MADRLSVYNGVMDLIGEEPLGSLNDVNSKRRKVDAVYNKIVRICLADGAWNFATRTIRVDSNPALEVQFGHQYAFNQPENMVRLVGIASDEAMRTPLTDFKTERRYWYANIDPIYVGYVDKSADFGFDLSLWPELFQAYVEAKLAHEVAQSIRESKVDYLAKLARQRLEKALAVDALEQPPEQKPVGRWRQRRYSGSSIAFRDDRA